MAIARAIKYYVIYFILFTILAVAWRLEPSLPPCAYPAVNSIILLPVFAIMCFRLVVWRPQQRFALPSLSARWMRFAVYLGCFILLVLMAAIGLGVQFARMESWWTGIVPFFLFQAMVQPLKADIRLPHRPKSPDSRWRSLKYSLVYINGNLLLVVGIAILFADTFVNNMWAAILITATVSSSIVFGALYRIVVLKPHSRFNNLPKPARLKRLAQIFAAYCLFAWGLTTAIAFWWQWEMDFPIDAIIVIAIFQTAVFGSDGAPGPKASASPSGPDNTGDIGDKNSHAAIRQQLMQIKARNAAAGMAKKATGAA